MSSHNSLRAILTLNTASWPDKAECLDAPPEIFFPVPKKEEIDPEEHGEYATHSPEDAKAYCRKCVVREECLEYGVKNNEMGIWGGMTRRERRALKKRRREQSKHGLD